jgi:tRNA A-37 threonylcarbamoyl transferase component Bud32
VNLGNRRSAPFEPRPDLAATADPSAEGGPLLGDYEILAEVGHGGMAVVYKARQRRLNRIVALKVTRAGRWLSQDDVRRFQAETTAIARLDHPNIVPIYEVGEAHDLHFFSMAFVEGESLAQVVDRCPLPPSQAAALIHLVSTAIAHAHAQGVIHRDLKPANILLDRSGRPRITDFGIARFSDVDSRLTQAGEVIGTPSFMPPEQAQGQTDQVGPTADVYSLGATLYCLLTGRPPFRAATGLETLKQVVERDPVSPSHLNPAVDQDLETICLKCLEKRPERRYASATALAEDLQRFLDHQPIQARPIGSVQKALRWFRRNPLPAALLASVVLVFLTAFGLVAWSWWRAEEAWHQEANQRAAANLARDEARRHERAERWEHYRANMATLASAFGLHNIAAARRSLQAAPREHRNWEWQYFHHLLDQSRQVLSGHQGGVVRARFARNDRLVTVDRRLRPWDLATGRMIRTLPDFSHGPWPVLAVDPKGRLLAYQARDKTIIVHDLVTDQKRMVLRGCDGPIAALLFGPDSSSLAACTHSQQAHVWNTATGHRLRSWSAQHEQLKGVGFDLFPRRLFIAFKDGTIACGTPKPDASWPSSAVNRRGPRLRRSIWRPSGSSPRSPTRALSCACGMPRRESRSPCLADTAMRPTASASAPTASVLRRAPSTRLFVSSMARPAPPSPL